MTFKELESLNSKLFGFVSEITRFGNCEKTMLLEVGDGYNITFFTFENKYHIRATNSYLGCVVNKRKPSVGEDHTRGSDLADGDFTKETWDRIKNDIISYEMKNLQI